MEKIKVILDRKKVSSEEIASRQDLNSVLKGASTNVPIWKSGWFYGSVGLASVAIVAITVTWNQSANVDTSNERVLTASLTDSNVITAVHEVIQKPETDVLLAADEKVKADELDVNKTPPVNKTVEKKVIQRVEDLGDLEEEASEEIAESTPVSETSVTPKTTPSIAKVNGVVNKMPNIAGVYYGPIAIEKLCSNNRITSSPDIDITSFKINYNTMDGDVVKSVSGDMIPEDICSQLKRWNLNSTVFITEIRGVSAHGEVLMLSSMSLIPTK
ncbi:MAG: hypothetical protein ACO2Z9_04510 [Crocinitomicaceae bacterium]